MWTARSEMLAPQQQPRPGASRQRASLLFQRHRKTQQFSRSVFSVRCAGFIHGRLGLDHAGLHLAVVHQLLRHRARRARGVQALKIHGRQPKVLQVLARCASR